MNCLISIIVLVGILAPASPDVLKEVEDRRLKYGWGLFSHAPEDTILIAVDN